LKDEPASGLDCSGDFKAAPDIRYTRAGCRWRLCTAQAAKGQGAGGAAGRLPLVRTSAPKPVSSRG